MGRVLREGYPCRAAARSSVADLSMLQQEQSVRVLHVVFPPFFCRFRRRKKRWAKKTTLQRKQSVRLCTPGQPTVLLFNETCHAPAQHPAHETTNKQLTERKCYLMCWRATGNLRRLSRLHGSHPSPQQHDSTLHLPQDRAKDCFHLSSPTRFPNHRRKLSLLFLAPEERSLWRWHSIFRKKQQIRHSTNPIIICSSRT